MKYYDRSPPDNTDRLLKVLHRLNEANRDEKLRSYPLTRKGKHLKGRGPRTHPNPNLLTRCSTLRKGGGFQADLAWGGADPPRRLEDLDVGGGSAKLLGHGRLRAKTRGEEKLAEQIGYWALYPLTAGSLDAPYVAPDASGEH